MRKKILAVLIAIVFILSSIPILANELRDLRDQYYDARADVADQQYELSVIREEIDQIYEELRALDEQLASASIDLHNINQVLYVTSMALEQAALDIVEAQDELYRQYEIIVDRLRDIQEQGTMGLLSVLFQATSLRDFLLRLEFVNNVARQDQEMVARLEASEVRLTRIQELYAEQLDSLEILQRRQQEYVAQLEYVEAVRVAYFETLLENEYSAAALLAFYQERMVYSEAIWREAYEADQRRREEERLERERRIQEENRRAMENLSGRFLWPVPSAVLADITSGFGPRTHPITRRHDNHSGIDIRAPIGRNIVAADDGVVILSGWNGGFGITVIIDHGDGIHTLYAHNSRNLVSVGDRVRRGDVIALIGTTGVSTGPHLHFEVRVGGRAVDPRPFLGI